MASEEVEVEYGVGTVDRCREALVEAEELQASRFRCVPRDTRVVCDWNWSSRLTLSGLGTLGTISDTQYFLISVCLFEGVDRRGRGEDDPLRARVA